MVNGIALARGMCWRKELPCNSANKLEKLLSLSAASAASKTLTVPIMRSDLAEAYIAQLNDGFSCFEEMPDVQPHLPTTSRVKAV